MKRHILTIILALAAIMTATAAGNQTKADALRRQMAAQARAYSNATEKSDRISALDSTFELNRQLLLDNATRIWEQLDTATATAADYRRIGVTMLASDQKKHGRWCMYAGAQLGDPYCINYVLIDQLKTDQDPGIALHLFSLLKGAMTYPLMHNIALAFSQIETDKPEINTFCQESAHTFGNLYFEVMDDPVYRYGPYERGQYIDFVDDPTLKMLKKSWFTPKSHDDVGRALRAYLAK